MRQQPFVIPEQGHWIRFCGQDEADPFEHAFCGAHNIPGAECPNCRTPLLRLLTLDLADARLQLASLSCPKLHLLYCWTCNEQAFPYVYSFDSDGGVSVIQAGLRGRARNFPYSDYPEYFPAQPIRLVPLTREDQDVLTRIGCDPRSDESFILQERYPELATPHHQVGGRPYLIQDFWMDTCPQCSAPTPMLAAISDDTGGEHEFTDNPFVQVVFHLCTACQIVSVKNICD